MVLKHAVVGPYKPEAKPIACIFVRFCSHYSWLLSDFTWKIYGSQFDQRPSIHRATDPRWACVKKNPHPFEELMFLFPFSTQKKKHQHFETHIRSQVVFLNEAWQVFLMVLETHFWAQPMAPGRRWQKEEGVEKRWRWRTETWSTERESL